MAGTIPLSMTQQFDELGAPLAGGKLYLIQAGTVSTPQNGYQDSALTIPWPNPIILSASGRIPQFFLADGSIKIRLADVNGVEILVADGLIVTGASSGGGGGSPVDATTVLATGDIKCRYGQGILAGFVRANGRTIGSATSGATERANSDAQPLFEYLWNNDPNMTVSGGRGASSIADWSANKTITVPDFRGRVIGGLDDMGNTAAGRMTLTYFGATGTTLGAFGGFESETLSLGELPAGITSASTQTITVAPSVGLFVSLGNGFITNIAVQSAANVAVPFISGGSWSGVASLSGSLNVATTSNNTGGQPHRIVQPTLLITVYLKL